MQEEFSGLLGDSNEVTQEMASRGISAAYAMSDEPARKHLLDGLVSTLQGVDRPWVLGFTTASNITLLSGELLKVICM